MTRIWHIFLIPPSLFLFQSEIGNVNIQSVNAFSCMITRKACPANIPVHLDLHLHVPANDNNENNNDNDNDLISNNYAHSSVSINRCGRPWGSSSRDVARNEPSPVSVQLKLKPLRAGEKFSTTSKLTTSSTTLYAKVKDVDIDIDIDIDIDSSDASIQAELPETDAHEDGFEYYDEDEYEYEDEDEYEYEYEYIDEEYDEDDDDDSREEDFDNNHDDVLVEEDDDIDELDLALRMQTITDEEALLACRAYLQRRNKLNPETVNNSVSGSESESNYLSNNNDNEQGGWVQARVRKQKLQNSLMAMNEKNPNNINNNSNDSNNNQGNTRSGYEYGPGYFWEDPKELQYLRTGRPRMSFGGDLNGDETKRSGQVDELPDAEVDFATFNAQFKNNGGVSTDSDGEEYEDDSSDAVQDILDPGEEEGIFTSFPSFPPQSHVRRSKLKKDLFQDPEWKAKWYVARWGDEEEKKAMIESRRVKKIGSLIEQIPSDILTSPQLAALSDDEIEDAIKTYVVANERRSKSHKKRIRDRDRRRKLGRQRISSQDDDSDKDGSRLEGDREKEGYDIGVPSSPSSSIPTLDAFMMQSEESQKKALEEQQRRRSERSKKAYQTRIQNETIKRTQRTSSSTKKSRDLIATGRKTFDGGRQVSHAMDRIQEALDHSMKPSLSDVQLILEPKRLTRRKDILREILSTYFNLVGKCVPDLDESSRDDLAKYYQNASSSSIEREQMIFVTRSTVVELGEFVIYKLQQEVESKE